METQGSSVGWQRYVDPDFGMEFELPADWTAAATNYEDGYRELILSTADSPVIFIQRDEFTVIQSARQWYESNLDRYNPERIAVLGELQLAGDSALVIGQPETCDSTAMLVVIVSHGYSIVRIQYLELDPNANTDVLEHLLSTLQFSAPSGSAGEPTVVPAGLIEVPVAPASGDCSASPSAAAVEAPRARICPGAPMYIPSEGVMRVPWKCFNDERFCNPYKTRPPDDEDCGDYDIFCKQHSGIDIFGGAGTGVTPVYAPGKGTARRAGASAVRIELDGDFRGEWAYMTHMAKGTPYQD
jgi:hypothetical protein